MCKIEAVDGSNISAYTVHECDAINRVGMRSKRFVFTGHLNGGIQVSLLNRTSRNSVGIKFSCRFNCPHKDSNSQQLPQSNIIWDWIVGDIYCIVLNSHLTKSVFSNTYCNFKVSF